MVENRKICPLMSRPFPTAMSNVVYVVTAGDGNDEQQVLLGVFDSFDKAKDVAKNNKTLYFVRCITKCYLNVECEFEWESKKNEKEV